MNEQGYRLYTGADNQLTFVSLRDKNVGVWAIQGVVIVRKYGKSRTIVVGYSEVAPHMQQHMQLISIHLHGYGAAGTGGISCA